MNMIRNMTTFDLHDADTDAIIREATPAEALASVDAADRDGGAGIILVSAEGDILDGSEWAVHLDGTRRCYVIGDADLIRATYGSDT